MKYIRGYPAKFLQDEDGRYHVTFPDLPEALTDGADVDEAQSEAADCLEEAIAGRINRGDVIPGPSRIKVGMLMVFLNPQFIMKILLYREWKSSGLTKTRFADLLQIDEKEVRRMLDPKHGSKLSKFEQAMHALGKRIVIGLENVA